MKYAIFSIIFSLIFCAQVFGEENPDLKDSTPATSGTTKVENPDTATDTAKPADDTKPADTAKPADKTADVKPADSGKPVDTPVDIPGGSIDIRPASNQDLLAKEAKEKDRAKHGNGKGFVIPDGFRLSMDFKGGYWNQYNHEGGVNIGDVKHESYFSEGLFRFEFGNGRFGVAAFLFGRNISQDMEQGWATYLGHELPQLENWIQTHYSVVAGEFMFRPFPELRLNLFAQLGWRNLGFEYSPKVPLHAIAGFRFSANRYFNISAWAGTELGLEVGSMFWAGRNGELGIYARGNWLWNEEWRFDNIDFMRNVVEAEVGFKANLLGWIGFTLGGRHTWSYGWYPDEKNSFGQRQPALRLDSFQLFAGIQLTF